MFGFNYIFFEDFYCFPDGFNFELGSIDPIMVVAQIYLQHTFLFGFLFRHRSSKFFLMTS